MAGADRRLFPLGLLFDIGPVLALLALAGDALTLKLLLEQVAFVRYARALQSKLLRNQLGGLQLPVAAQVSQQRYQVAAFITAGKVVPPARHQVDAERPRLASCHTGVINGKFVEGHVPAEQVVALTQRNDLKGIAVPGMPMGSPGMEMDDRKDAYQVIGLDNDGKDQVIAEYPGN